MGRRQKDRKEKRNLKLSTNLRSMIDGPTQRLSKNAQIAPAGLAKKVELPDDEKELLKEVPAKVDGIVVGKALLYDDHSVDIIIDEDADPELVAKIKATEKEFGYTLGTD